MKKAKASSPAGGGKSSPAAGRKASSASRAAAATPSSTERTVTIDRGQFYAMVATHRGGGTATRSFLAELRARDARVSFTFPNPKRARGNKEAACAKYDVYGKATTLAGFFHAGGCGGDLAYDLGRGYCEIAAEDLDRALETYEWSAADVATTTKKRARPSPPAGEDAPKRGKAADAVAAAVAAVPDRKSVG